MKTSAQSVQYLYSSPVQQQQQQQQRQDETNVPPHMNPKTPPGVSKIDSFFTARRTAAVDAGNPEAGACRIRQDLEVLAGSSDANRSVVQSLNPTFILSRNMSASNTVL